MLKVSNESDIYACTDLKVMTILPLISSMRHRPIKKLTAAPDNTLRINSVDLADVRESANETPKLRASKMGQKAVQARVKILSWVLKLPKKLRVGQNSAQLIVKAQLSKRFPNKAASIPKLPIHNSMLPEIDTLQATLLSFSLMNPRLFILILISSLSTNHRLNSRS